MKRLFIIAYFLILSIFAYNQKYISIYTKCEKLIEENLSDSAIIIANQYLDGKRKITSEDYHVFFIRGMAYKDVGSFELAIDDFSLIIDNKVEEFYEQSIENRSFSYYQLNHVSLAQRDISEALRINPLNEKAWYLLFLINYFDNYIYADALFAINKAINISPSSINYFSRYNLLLEEAEYPKAFTDLGNAINEQINIIDEVYEEINHYNNYVSTSLKTVEDSIKNNNFTYSYLTIKEIYSFLNFYSNTNLSIVDSLYNNLYCMVCKHNTELKNSVEEKINNLQSTSKTLENLVIISLLSSEIECSLILFFTDTCNDSNDIKEFKKIKNNYFEWIIQQELNAQNAQRKQAYDYYLRSTPWAQKDMSMDEYLNYQAELVRIPPDAGKIIRTGKRGGQYYINQNGNKTYIRR